MRQQRKLRLSAALRDSRIDVDACKLSICSKRVGVVDAVPEKWHAAKVRCLWHWHRQPFFAFKPIASAQPCQVCHIAVIYSLWLQTLYLSSNELTSLAGVEQFAQLESLSVVGNRLSKFANLAVLQQCSHLRHLRAEENPICRLPFYRCADAPFVCASSITSYSAVARRVQSDSLPLLPMSA